MTLRDRVRCYVLGHEQLRFVSETVKHDAPRQYLVRCVRCGRWLEEGTEVPMPGGGGMVVVCPSWSRE